MLGTDLGRTSSTFLYPCHIGKGNVVGRHRQGRGTSVVNEHPEDGALR
jgi:hypothetical protein